MGNLVQLTKLILFNQCAKALRFANSLLPFFSSLINFHTLKTVVARSLTNFYHFELTNCSGV